MPGGGLVAASLLDAAGTDVAVGIGFVAVGVVAGSVCVSALTEV